MSYMSDQCQGRHMQDRYPHVLPHETSGLFKGVKKRIGTDSTNKYLLLVKTFHSIICSGKGKLDWPRISGK